MNGPAGARTLRTAAPLVFAQLAFAANTFVTQFLLSRHSATALHASLPASTLAVTYMAFFNATLGYVGTIFARRDGAGDGRGAMSAFFQSAWLSLFAMPLLALGMPVARVVLSMFNTPPEVFAAETRYFDVLMLNAAFTILAQVLGGFFTGRGKTGFVGAVTVFGFAVNMAISPAFIAGFAGLPGGIAGAGIAQTVAHAVPCVILATAIARHPDFRRRTVSAMPSLSARETVEILRLGIPNGLRAILEIGGFFVFTALVAECSPAAVAASTALFAVNGVPYGCVQGLAAAVEILVGRASGRLEDGEARGVIVASSTYAAVFASAYAAALWLFQDGLLGLFLPASPAFDAGEYHATARALVMIIAAKAVFEMGSLVLQGALRGLGRTDVVFRVQAISTFAIWMPTCIAAKLLHPTVPVFWATMILASASSVAMLVRRLHKALKTTVANCLSHKEQEKTGACRG